jgi:microcystin-dependent protein
LVILGVPNFSQASVTNAGVALIAEAAAAEGQITFTSIQVGSGTMSGGQTPQTMTALVTPVGNANFDGANTAVTYQATLRWSVSSALSSTLYQLNEYGVFARIGTGPIILFAYANAVGTGDEIPPTGGGTVVFYQYATLIPFSLATSTVADYTPTSTVEPHAPTHLDNGVDPIPLATSTRTGLLTKLTGAAGTFLNYLGHWAFVDRSQITNWKHALTHVDVSGGTTADLIPAPTTSNPGLVPILNGNSVNYLGSDGGWHAFSAIPIVTTTAPGLMFQLSGNAGDYAGGDGSFHALPGAPASLFSTGDIKPTLASTADGVNWLMMDGSSHLRTSFPALAAMIGGTGTHFTVPNTTGLVLLGAGTGYSLMSTGGEAAHTLTISEMPSHSHDAYWQRSYNPASPPPSFVVYPENQANSTGSYPTSSVGGGVSHNNMQPYMATNYMIKT